MTWAGRAAYFDQLREKVAEVPGDDGSAIYQRNAAIERLR